MMGQAMRGHQRRAILFLVALGVAGAAGTAGAATPAGRLEWSIW
jgi:hypothetical protein